MKIPFHFTAFWLNKRKKNVKSGKAAGILPWAFSTESKYSRWLRSHWCAFMLCYVSQRREVSRRQSVHPSVDEERPTTFLTHSAARISRSSSARAGILARSAHMQWFTVNGGNLTSYSPKIRAEFHKFRPIAGSLAQIEFHTRTRNKQTPQNLRVNIK